MGSLARQSQLLTLDRMESYVRLVFLVGPVAMCNGKLKKGQATFPSCRASGRGRDSLPSQPPCLSVGAV